MVDLAMSDPNQLVKVKDIAKRQAISEKYLEQIIATLNRAGIVKSARGAHGGYRLAKDPGEYTVLEILRLTEGSMAPVACLEDEENQCEHYNTCASIEVWEGLYEVICNYLKNITIGELARKQKDRLTGNGI